MSNAHVVTKESRRFKLGGWETVNRHQCDHSGFRQHVLKQYNGNLTHFIIEDQYECSFFDHKGDPNEVIYLEDCTKFNNGEFVKIWKKLVPDLTITTSNTWYRTDVNNFIIDTNIGEVLTMKISDI